MNKHVHRLIFDRKRGMRVPAAEHTRSAGKAAGGQSRAASVVCTAVVLGMAAPGAFGARSIGGQVPRAEANQLSRGGASWSNRTNPNHSLPVLSTADDRIKSNSSSAAFNVSTNESGTSMLINQFDRRIIINWDSFNLGRGNTVEFKQVDKGTALNKIWDQRPSVILGNIKANGEVILESQNGGFIFGSGARVDAQRFVATALAVSNQTFLNGLLRNNKVGGDLADYLSFDGTGSSPYYTEGEAAGLTRGVVVERGAEIRALAGGDVILVGPSVYNEGRIETPSGQTVMAAGQKVYLMATASDQTQRGLMVAVDAYKPGTVVAEDGSETPARLNDDVNVVEQAQAQSYDSAGVDGLARKVNAVVAEKGSINLVALTIRQNGLLSATTAVKGQNGVITLEAGTDTAMLGQTWMGGVNADGTASTGPTTLTRPIVTTMGAVTFGAGSQTEVTPPAERAPAAPPNRSDFAEGDAGELAYKTAKASYEAVTQTDSEIFLRSRISAMGKDVTVESGASIQAKAGNVDLLALTSAYTKAGNASYLIAGALSGGAEADTSTLTIQNGATIDVAGLRDVLLPMSRNELSGRLFKIELADAPVQRDGVLYRQAIKGDAFSQVKVADTSGFYNVTRRDAHEWMTVGGNINLNTQGRLTVDQDARLDVSGGSVRYAEGRIGSTLLRKGDRLVHLSDADAGVRYDELLVTPDGADHGRLVKAYEHGFDAGSIVLNGASGMQVGLQAIKGDVIIGPMQKAALTAEQMAVKLGKKSDEAYTHAGTSRAIGRPAVLNDKPHLYATLRPKAFGLTIGQTFGDQAVPMVNRIVLGGTGSTTGEGGGDLFDLSALKYQLGMFKAVAQSLDVTASAKLPAANGAKVVLESVDGLKFAGQIDAADADVTLKSRLSDVQVASTAVLNLSGDQIDATKVGSTPEIQSADGGDLTVSAGQSALFAKGSSVDVSAGVLRDGTGSVTKGAAGGLSVTVNAKGAVGSSVPLNGAFQFGGTLRAFDFQKGGSFALKGLRSLDIIQGGGNLSSGEAELKLASSFFSDHGFGKFSLSAVGDVSVAEDVNLTPTLRNLGTQFRGGKTGYVREVILPTVDRTPLSLSLEATAAPAFSLLTPYEGLTQASKVTVAKNAVVNVGAGGSINLKAAGSTEVAGALVARGGSVTLGISGVRGGGGEGTSASSAEDKAGYLSDQQVLLSATGSIDVSGIDLTYQQSPKVRAGQVLGGGSVFLNPSSNNGPVRGKVVTEEGSLINLDGASGQLSDGENRITTLSKGAGRLLVNSADGFVLAGKLSAKRPDDSVGAGSFYASLSREGVSDVSDPNFKGKPYPLGERQVVLTAGKSEVVSQAAEARGVVSAEQLAEAGFDRIHLRSEGRVVLGDGASVLSANGAAPLRSVVLNAPVIEAKGTGEHVVRASHVALGDVDLPLPYGKSKAASGVATLGESSTVNDQVQQPTLKVQAGLIEVHGHAALQGISRTELDATLAANNEVGQRTDGEIRFVGRTYGNTSPELEGSLAYGGELLMRAGQSYATTLSRYTVEGLKGQSALKVQLPGGPSTSRTPMSALAKLTFKAHSVDIDGVIRQPFGSLTIEGETKPVLGANSLLSVSGDGVAVPVGSTINKSAWVYTPGGLVPNEGAINTDSGGVVTQLSGAMLEKGITVKGPGLSIDEQSRIEAQAGGDLLTWEFLSGVGGTRDTLARKDVFAVVPGYSYDFAPHDAEIMASQTKAGTTLIPGERIVITTDNDVLPKGVYTLLPARYAILPGAVLVSRIDSGDGAAIKAAEKQDDGGVRVAGHRTGTGTAINGGNDSRLSFLLEPERTHRAQSDLSISSVSALLAEQATKRGQPTPTRPGDAGRVSLWSTQGGFDWAARYNLAGGQLDLAMAGDMALVDVSALDGKNKVGEVSVKQLTSTGAGSILLGGVRSGPASDSTITTVASKVGIQADYGQRVVEGSQGSGELIVVGSSEVKVADGKTIQATMADSGRANKLTVNGSGAALVVSNLGATELKRTLDSAGANTEAMLRLRSDSVGEGEAAVRGDGAILKGRAVHLDSTGSVAGLDVTRSEEDASLLSRGAVVVATENLGLGANTIVVGGKVGGAGELGLSGQMLDRKRVALRSYEAIEFQGAQNLGGAGLQRLTLDTPRLLGTGQASDVVKLSAQQVVLRNASGASGSNKLGQTSLLIEATPPVRDATAEGVRIEGGSQMLAFQQAELKSSGDIVFSGTGNVKGQGNVTLTAARVTAESGSDHGVDAAGVLTVQAYKGMSESDKGRTLNNTVGLGAKLALKGAQVAQRGYLDLRSGSIQLQGRSDSPTQAALLLGKDSKTSAAGVQIEMGKQVAAVSPGGTVALVAENGRIDIEGEVDVSAPDASAYSQVGVAAGEITIRATGAASGSGLNLAEAASLKGSAAQPSQSGRLKVDVANLLTSAGQSGSLDRLAQAMESGGIQGEFYARTTQGNLTLNRSLTAGRVQLTADAVPTDASPDQGSIQLGTHAEINTTAAAARGGVVLLGAQQNISMADGSAIVASASKEGTSGGDVLLNSRNGQINLAQGSSIDSGTSNGRIVMRGQLNAAANALSKASSLQGDLTAGQTLFEAVKVEAGTTNVLLNATTQKAIGDKAKAFEAHAATVRNGLSLPANSKLEVRYGHEVATSGNIEVKDDWNLYAANRKAFNITLRAGQNLNINGSMSDGFITASPSATATPSSMSVNDAGSMRLVAGASTSSAELMRTQASVDHGDLTVAAGKLVRTTNGSIELAAGRDFILKGGATANDAQAVVYVAGKPVSANDLAGETSTSANRSEWQRFTHQGGRLDVQARRHITAPAATQGFGNWFLHTANESKASNVAWATDFDAFRQGLGSMGGGNVRVTAGGDITNLGVVAPTSARSYKSADGKIQQHVQNGGDVSVLAEGDIAGGMFFLGRGDGVLQAGGDIRQGDARSDSVSGTSFQAMAPVLGLMDGQWRLQALGDLAISAIYNPTALYGQTKVDTKVSSKPRVSAAQARSYVSYGDESAVALTSISGNVAWRSDLLQNKTKDSTSSTNGLLALHTAFGPERNRLSLSSASDAPSTGVLHLAPGIVEAAALTGSFEWVPFKQDLVLAPSVKGDLRIYAGRDVTLGDAIGQLAMLDFDARSATGSVQRPTTTSASVSGWNTTTDSALGNVSRMGLHGSDRRRAQILAGRDIDFQSTRLNLPKQVDVIAQGEIRSPSFSIYHNAATDVSRVEAGGSLIGATNLPGPTRPRGLMQLNGAGELQVQAGLSLNLSNAGGLEATGKETSIRVAAGMNKQVNVDELVSLFIKNNEQARGALITYVQDTLNVGGLSFDQALALYRDMTPAHQTDFAQRKLVLPAFASSYVLDDGAKADVVWAWVARASGQSAVDQNSPLYAEYQAAQRALVSYVESTQGKSGLSFEQALAGYRAMTGTEKATFVDKRKTVSPVMVMAFLAAEKTSNYASQWQQLASTHGVEPTNYESPVFSRFMEDVLMREVQRLGTAATAVGDSSNALLNPRREEVRNALWDQLDAMSTAAGLKQGFTFKGDVDLSGSKVHLTGASGIGLSSIDILAPGGGVLVGTATATENDELQSAIRGIATYGGGDVRSYSVADFQVASQKVHILGEGDMILYSSQGNIDSGRGANTAVTVPPKAAVDDGYGTMVWKAGKSTVGSGMAIFADDQGRRDGRISLLTPRGEVRALDAFIDAPSLDVPGPVQGGDNLKGKGAPPPAPPVSVSLSLNTGLGSESAAGQAQQALAAQQDKPKDRSSLLTVDVLSIGGEPAAGEQPKPKAAEKSECKEAKGCAQ